MKEKILCKYGEIVLKGGNRGNFESLLLKELRFRASKCGHFKVTHSQSVIFIDPLDDEADIDAMFEAASRTYGIISLARAAECDKTLEAICETAKSYLPRFLDGVRTFKVESKRADKTFPLKSLELSAQVGGAILSVCPHLKVNVKNPDVTVLVEVRGEAAYVHAGQVKGAGGIPLGSGGRGLLLLSGGIDSPVAGCMMAKRGIKLEALHFESFPYTSQRAKEKVLDLARLMTKYVGGINVHVISLTHIQEVLMQSCEEDYFTLLLRRFMMTIAERVARQNDCRALITGESLGQVASQTIEAICVTDAAVNMPVFRPCIGLDKEEIVTVARRVGTFETSILPFEDCCTVFTPRHPKTKPTIENVKAEEAKIDFDALVEEALATETVERIKYEA